MKNDIKKEKEIKESACCNCKCDSCSCDVEENDIFGANNHPELLQLPENYLEEFKKLSKTATIENISEVIAKIYSYNHDYSSICTAMEYSMLAAFNAVNGDKLQGGMTRFQMSFVAMDLMRDLLYIKGPFKMIEFYDLLYPQNDYKFKTISKKSWYNVQKMAYEKIEEDRLDKKGYHSHPDVLKHWGSIVEGNIPFGFYISEPVKDGEEEVKIFKTESYYPENNNDTEETK